MRSNKDHIPQFETEEQEAEYWDKHSPLDLATEPKAQRVRAKIPKDRPITIRLDSVSRSKLEKLAVEQGLGPSTFARHILVSAIEGSIEGREKLPRSIAEEQVDNKVKQTVSTAEIKLQESLHRALDGDWRTAISLSREATSNVPEEYFAYIKGEMQMIWSCIQRTCVEPLLIKAENSVLNWDYDEATSAVVNILDICKAAQLPLDYGDLCIRILGVAQATCAAAAGWKGDIDAKLNRVVAGVGVLHTTIEDSINIMLGSQVLPKQVVGGFRNWQSVIK